jgi:hypothetical protein
LFFVFYSTPGFFIIIGSGMGQVSWVVIEVDQERVARYSLWKDRITNVEGPLGKNQN